MLAGGGETALLMSRRGVLYQVQGKESLEFWIYDMREVTVKDESKKLLPGWMLYTHNERDNPKADGRAGCTKVRRLLIRTSP